MHVWMNLDHACVVSWTTAALVPGQMDELQMRTSNLLAYFGQHCENRQGCTLMTAPPDDTVYPTKAWPHLLFELWRSAFIHISDENFLSKLASSSTVLLQMLLVPLYPEPWQFKTCLVYLSSCLLRNFCSSVGLKIQFWKGKDIVYVLDTSILLHSILQCWLEIMQWAEPLCSVQMHVLLHFWAFLKRSQNTPSSVLHHGCWADNPQSQSKTEPEDGVQTWR